MRSHIAAQTDVVTLSVVVADPYDGATRLLCDAQRFGLVLSEFNACVNPGGYSAISLSVVFPEGLDCASVETRLARHPTVSSVFAVVAPSQKVQSGENACGSGNLGKSGVPRHE